MPDTQTNSDDCRGFGAWEEHYDARQAELMEELTELMEERGDADQLDADDAPGTEES
jgi:hypothetical protein